MLLKIVRFSFLPFVVYFCLSFFFSVGEGVCGEDLSLNTNTEISVGILCSVVWGFFYHLPHFKNCFCKIKISTNSVLQTLPWPPLCPWGAGGSSFALCSLRMSNNGPSTFTRAPSPACSEEFCQIEPLGSRWD